MVENRPLPSQIKIAVIGQIDDGRRVGRSPVVDPQFVGVIEAVHYLHVKGARVEIFAIRAAMVQKDAHLLFILEGLGLPDNFVKAAFATMQMVRPIVVGELVAHTIQFKARAGQTVGKTTHQRAEVGMAR